MLAVIWTSHRQTDRQTNGKRDRQTDKHTEEQRKGVQQTNGKGLVVIQALRMSI